MIKKSLFLLLSLLLVFGLVFIAGCGSDVAEPIVDDEDEDVEEEPAVDVPPEPVFIAIGGGPSGGMYNNLAAALEEVVGPQLDWITLSAEGTGGGGENLEWTSTGELDFAVSDGLSIYQAYNGIGGFEGNQKPDIRAIGMLVQGTNHVVTLEGKGIETLYDLAGKTVAIGTPGSSTALIAEELYTALGIWDSIQKEYLLGGTAIDALKDGHVDALAWNSSHPAGPVIDLASSHDVILIDTLTPAVESGFMDDHPYVWGTFVPAGTYDNEADVPVQAAAIVLIANANVDEQAVYEFVMAAFQSGDALSAAFGPMRVMTPENGITGIAIPLHPGAQRAYEELGVTIPDAIKAP